MHHSSQSQWVTAALGKAFLEKVRGAMPCADIQIDILLKIVSQWRPQVASVLDIGCGDALLGRAVAARFPGLHLTCVDISETMLAAAREKIAPHIPSRLIQADLGAPE